MKLLTVILAILMIALPTAVAHAQAVGKWIKLKRKGGRKYLIMSKRAAISSVLAFLLVFSLLLSVSNVSAQIATPDLKVTLLNQDPDPVEQDDVVEVRFKVENEGTETRDIVYMQLLPEYPFTLYSGSPIQEIGKLRAGQSGADAVIVRYKLKVDENAAEGDNEIKLQLKIGEALWQVYNDNDFFVDVKDYDIPGIKVYLRETTINSAGKKGTVTFEIANADNADVKFLQLTLLPSEGYQILSSSNYAYIGDVASDDTETEEFEIYSDKGAKGEMILPVKVEYQDSNDKKYENMFPIKLRIYDSSELKALGIVKENYAPYILGAIAILAALFFYWRSRRRKK